MSEVILNGAGPGVRSSAAADLYRSVWRFHFYAGLLVLPFLVLLAVTGALYLFRDEIDAVVHGDLKRVEAQAGPQATPSAIVEAALAAEPGAAVKFMPPASTTASAEVTIKTAAGDRAIVYVDPYDARVLGSLPPDGTVMGIVRQLHGLSYFGPIAEGVIEIVGGWAILLVGTGVYLWWPRGGPGGAVSVRGKPGKRIFWRDLHAVTGIFVGGFIVFMALTGMPWSVFWGSYVNQWANGQNFGYPSGVRVDVPMSEEHLNHTAPTSWSLEQARVPQSVDPGGAPIGLDAAVATFGRLGLHPGYAISLPAGPTGVYSGSVYPDDLNAQRVIHLDQYSGRPLLDMSYADYGLLGRGLEWGINVHMGQEFGLANQLLMLAVCVSVVLLAVTAAVMWWKRRPQGRLGVPPLPADRRALRGVVAILAIGGILFPLVGLSLLVVIALDRLFVQRRSRAMA